MENNAAEPGQPVDPNEALARLQQLEEETKRLREQLQASSAPAAPASTPVTAPADAPESKPEVPSARQEDSKEKSEEELPPAPTDAQREEADKLLQRYRLEKQRGNKDFAERYLAEAVQLAPGYTYVVECQADEALSNRKSEEAKRLYRLARRIDPKNHSADGKLADLVFRSEAAPAAAMLKVQEVSASAKSAAIMTALLPGLGQLVTGQTVKGICIIILWVFLLIFSPAGIQSLTALATSRGEVQTGPLLALLATFFVYIGALVDMNAYSKSTAAREALLGLADKKKDRPKPPDESDNLPFE